MATSDMNIHYLTSSHTNPHFYIFTQLFEAEHTDGAALDLSCDWKGIQEASWQDFWLREGPPLLEEKWNKRFPEYKAIETGEDWDEAAKRHWLDLWEEHVKDLVNRIWHIFSCAFENYQQELLKSFAPITTEDLDEVDEELEQLDLSETQPESKNNQKKDIFAEDEPYLSGNDEPEFLAEKKQRKLQSSSYDDRGDSEEAKLRELLGLPVSFGAQPKRRQPRVEQNSSNYDNAEDFEEEEVERKPMGLSASNNSAAKEWFEQDFYSLANWDMTSDEEPETETEAEALHAVLNGFIKKKKPKKKKKKKKTSRLEDQMPDFIKENKGKLFKYWLKRFSLFSRFDQGIRLDRESWFSVTPEKIAKQTARRLACGVILDAFCGCGGNAIQFALTCARVVAVDIDAEKLAMAKHNARIYGVADKIEFIHADFLQFAVSTNLRPDVVFFSPPWGGPNYIKQATFDIERSLLPVSASLLMGLGRRLADNVGFFLPRNTSISQVIALSGVGQQCEVEHNFLDTRLVALTAYFGNGLIKKK
ncbi:trimethylguanosine synthase [Drosophila madeirensis]|uniref:Trimethylguanosine synthase n=1 Tax=Drosophila madeirensis TaxID=30013 RepID=A0AAU9EQX6_DROMD